MNHEIIKKAVLEHIKEHPGTSYVSIGKLFDRLGFDYKGYYTSCLPGYPSIVSWDGWNREAFEVVNVLLDEELIERAAAPLIVYLIDGGGLNLPIAKSLRHYKQPRWMPIVYSIKKETNQ